MIDVIKKQQCIATGWNVQLVMQMEEQFAACRRAAGKQLEK